MNPAKSSREALFRTALANLLRDFEDARQGIPWDAMVVEGAHALLNGSEAELERAMLDAVIRGIDNADLTDAVQAEAGRQGPERLARAIIDALNDAGPNLARRQHYGE